MNHQIVAISWDHHKTPINFRDAISLNWMEQQHFLDFSLENNTTIEIVALSTCNRIEFYTVSKNAKDAIDAIQHIYANILQRTIFWTKAEPEIYIGIEAFRHLCRVGVGMESMVIGEDQILSQVKVAQKSLEQMQPEFHVLIKLFRSAILLAEEVRKELPITAGPSSISVLAVQKVIDMLGNLEKQRILIIGAGETAALTAQTFKESGVTNFIIANRNRKNGIALAERINGQYISLDSIDERLESCDIVVAATNKKDFIIDKVQIERIIHKREKDLILLDISTPRNIDPTIRDIENIYLLDLDHLYATIVDAKDANIELLDGAEALIINASENIMDSLQPSYPQIVGLEFQEEAV